ncbi:MAG: oxidoreductase [Jatrophihabitantaceae bacterium]
MMRTGTAKWTAADIGDQTGRTVVVTGANSGLGSVTARALAEHGATVIMACRNLAKAQRVSGGIEGDTEVRPLDLSDLGSVREFASGVDRLDVLVNNAGVMALPEGRTKDGFEMQFGTNHLGHFALTGLLLPKITDRVVTVSSGAHRIGKIALDDLNFEQRHYRRWGAYGQAKLANLMFAFELQRRLTAAASPVRSIAVHPGYAATDLQAHTDSWQDRLMTVGNWLIGQTPEMGALPSLFAATSPDARGGEFYGPDGLFALRGHPTTSGSASSARDLGVAQRLWDRSEQLTGVSFP